ncbi:hypothetical protein KVR01_006407 [Diaporthe batatas]|uniref:uncharacterized protein n=1 Tax=Diaporthe batatas TaxID=748121 RepID=UPI001D055572|nr:uncharacterized protein KVR01_006407 [Diaporthe batatas]KAG8164489.1 hypothetical protein KVR01_006407 [Diaporthe batatas]
MPSFPKPREQGPKASIGDILDVQHGSAAILAITNILSTSRAEITMAQLIDGLPLRHIAKEGRGHTIGIGHPLQEHRELCEGALDRARAWVGALDVLEQFQATDPGSHNFNLRLVETTVVAIHEIAIELFEDRNKSHNEEELRRVTLWRMDPIIVNRYDVPPGEALPPPSPQPTLFFHSRYLDYENYPAGLGDMAAYWAEDKIFGGVVLFDRGESDTECKAVYLHSNSWDETVRVWKLLDHQMEALLGLFKAEKDSSDGSGGGGAQTSCPLPLICERSSRLRFDDWDAMAVRHIYRDPWERKVPEKKDFSVIRINDFDYP